MTSRRFVTHPFDVGDRVMVDNNSFIVKELGILTTVFQMWNGQVVYSPNSVLASKAIVNIRRSSCQTEVLEIHIAFSTAPEKLKELENRINDWLASESRDFSPTMKILPYEIENMNKIKIQLLLEHRSNWQEMEKRWARRSKFLLWLKDTLVDIGISYTYPVQPFTNKV